MTITRNITIGKIDLNLMVNKTDEQTKEEILEKLRSKKSASDVQNAEFIRCVLDEENKFSEVETIKCDNLKKQIIVEKKFEAAISPKKIKAPKTNLGSVLGGM